MEKTHAALSKRGVCCLGHKERIQQTFLKLSEHLSGKFYFFMVASTQEDWDLRQPFLFKERMCRMTEWVLELTLCDGRLSPKSVGLPLSRGTALDLPVCPLH